MANVTRSALSATSSSNFPDNTTQLISPADLRDWITDGIDSFVTQKDVSTLENAFYECKGSSVTASATTDLGLATGNFLHITGTPPVTITSFGTVSAGARFIVCFDIAVTITYNGTSLIIPGASNITTTAGDCMMLISEGAGNWRVVGYFPGTGLPVGTVTAVTASSPLSSTGGNAPNLSIPQATGSVDGYLSSTDWTTFDGKQDALTLTTTGTSGAATLIGSTLNIPQYSGGGTPGGADTEIQYNNGGAFGGVSDLTWDDINNVLTINTPRIGQSNGNGHMHIHSGNSAPSGITDYLTMFWQKATRVLGFRSETDTYESYIQLTAPTADRTYTLPDESGNVVLDSATQTLTNKTLTSPSITTPAITTPAITGIATLNNGTSAGEIRLREGSGGGTNYTAIKAAATLGADYSLTLPSSAPASGQSLISDGSGNLSWSSNPGTTSNQFVRTYGGTSTGTTSEAIVQSMLIPANTFTGSAGFKISSIITRSNPGGTGITLRYYINTSAAIGGFNLSSTGFVVAANPTATFQMTRVGFIQVASGTPSSVYVVTTTASNENSSGALTTSAIDWSIDQYVVLTVVSTASASTITCNALQLMPQ